MKSISSVWTLVYKESEGTPLAFTYTNEKDANIAKSLVEECDGDITIDDQGFPNGRIQIEWCYLIRGKLIYEKE